MLLPDFKVTENIIAMTEQDQTVKTEQAPSSLEHKLELVVAEADLEKAASAELKKLAKDARMPGFRKGHVPMDQVRAMYGERAYGNALNQLVGQAWMKAAQESDLRIAGEPSIVDSGRDEEKAALLFTATFEVFPDVEIPDFSALELKRYTCTVGDAEVEKTIDVMRCQRVNFTEEEGRAAQADDQVTLDFKGTKGGEAFKGGTAQDYTFVLGQGRMLPEFEAAVTGMKAGDTKTFPMTFPAEYGIAELNGAEVEFEVTIKKVCEPHYPEINDEFAKSLGVEGGIEKMRSEIRANLEREVKARLENKTKAEVMEAVNGLIKFDVPKAIVAEEEKSLTQAAMQDLAARGMDPKKLPKIPEGLFTEQASRRVRLGLFVSTLVEQEKIAGTEEQARAIAEEIASSYEDPSEVVTYIMGDANRLFNLRNQATESNVTEWILSKAKTSEEAVDFDQLMGQQPTA